jgi:membrane associated rhomboid family serine protease
MKLRYNAPVSLSFSLISAVVLLISQLASGQIFTGQLTPNSLIAQLFTISPAGFSFASPLSWLRLFTHVIGHANWAHLIGNFSFILLIGPILEEKYGSFPVLLMMLVTALATGLLDLLIERATLFGASGIVFMLILLSSFTNIRSGEIPLTFILIVILYVVKELIDAFTPDTVSHVTHIAGGIIGGLFGFLFSKKETPPAQPGAGPLPSETEKTLTSGGNQ